MRVLGREPELLTGGDRSLGAGGGEGDHRCKSPPPPGVGPHASDLASLCLLSFIVKGGDDDDGSSSADGCCRAK